MKPIIDVSYWQNPRNIDYDRLAAAISGVIIRATYGSRKDAYFEQHYAEFKARGIPVGVYGFIVEYLPAAEQVAAFAEMCAGKQFPLGYWGDVEAEAGAELLTLPTIGAWLAQADAKLDTRCGIYTSWWMWQICALNSLDFGNRPLWVAHYGVNSPRLPAGWTTWLFHQFSSTVIHPGYAYVLDTNRFNGDDAKWAAYLAAGSSTTTPVPVIDPLWRGRVVPEIGLNVRSGRNFLNNVIRVLLQGEVVGVYEEAGTWARIAPYASEWVAKRFLAPVKVDPEPPKVLWKGEVIPEIGLNVRSSRDFSDNVLITLPQGMDVEVYEDDGTWARIDPTEQQWVVKRFLEVIKDGEPIPSDPNTGDGVLAIPPLWQRDPRWASVKLGTSNTTIGGYGCLSPICVTMYVNWLLGTDYSPIEVHDAIKAVGGYVNAQGGLTNANLFRFASLWEAFPAVIAADKLIRTPLTPAPLAEIDKVLADGRPVIVETRLNKVSQHWVLIVGKRDGKYVINDPWTGKTIVFEDVYGDAARWIYSIVSYRRL